MQMSLNQLEREYSPSSVAPDFMSTVEQYRAASDFICTRHVPLRVWYGNSADEYSLLFEPAGAAASSMLVFIHGGYWQELSAQDSCFPAEGLLARGIAYAAINYSLAPPRICLEWSGNAVSRSGRCRRPDRSAGS